MTHTEAVREWRRKNPEKNKAIYQAWNRKNPDSLKNSKLKYVYGITLKDYNRMLNRQNCKCAICRKIGIKFKVDHNHKTTMVRGLLCSNCNTGLGMFDENPRALHNAIKYLRKYDKETCS